MDSAPITELKLASTVRLYERIKLAANLAVLLVLIVIGVYLIILTKADHQSLVILKCAVDKTVQFDSHGHSRSAEDARRFFDACVARG